MNMVQSNSEKRLFLDQDSRLFLHRYNVPSRRWPTLLILPWNKENSVFFSWSEETRNCLKGEKGRRDFALNKQIKIVDSNLKKKGYLFLTEILPSCSRASAWNTIWTRQGRRFACLYVIAMEKFSKGDFSVIRA